MTEQQNRIEMRGCLGAFIGFFTLGGAACGWLFAIWLIGTRLF